MDQLPDHLHAIESLVNLILHRIDNVVVCTFAVAFSSGFLIDDLRSRQRNMLILGQMEKGLSNLRDLAFLPDDGLVPTVLCANSVPPSPSRTL